MDPEMPMIADDSIPTAPAAAADAQPSAEATPATATPTPALARFHSCRWRAQPEDGSFCTHRDVLPMAGKTGFNPESWCPDCQYFKVRRAPRKREYNNYNNNY
jgi:hypothetical protein